mmetsp:Transcript_37640/g.59413  ORF Transcript_37640/g.59413 Transcript_37640/m.59413 type:complete len:145 (-) Transcript_37640:79-513(-)
MGYDPNEPHVFSRLTSHGEKLEWTLSINHYDALPGGGVIPFLIRWEKNSLPFSPSSTSSSSSPGCFLISLCAIQEGEENEREEVEKKLFSLGIPKESFLVSSASQTLLGRSKVLSSLPLPSPSPSQKKRLIATLFTPKGVIEIS